jgi:hypothetical protein
MAALVTLIVGLALGLFYGHRLGVVAERSRYAYADEFRECDDIALRPGESRQGRRMEEAARRQLRKQGRTGR